MTKKKKERLELIDGEPWVIKYDQLHLEICCDCGLTHGFVIERIPGDKKKVIMKNYRDEYFTKKMRKANRIVFYKRKPEVRKSDSKKH